MQTDENLLKEIHYILSFHPGLDATHIFVIVKEGTVTLSGTVHSSTAKWMAKEAIKHISGIKIINEKLEIKPPNSN